MPIAAITHNSIIITQKEKSAFETLLDFKNAISVPFFNRNKLVG